ncbi:MAG: hypothetical protein V5A27_13225, partial [Halapricum sp.]
RRKVQHRAEINGGEDKRRERVLEYGREGHDHRIRRAQRPQYDPWHVIETSERNPSLDRDGERTRDRKKEISGSRDESSGERLEGEEQGER